MSAKQPKARIIWYGAGGVLDSVTVKDDGDRSVTEALIELVRAYVVAPGDSFSIERVTDE